ncbi:DUF3566 domain-containing protein [Naumannella cuiyingiana]|uniref:DUF3566 domain-containing protein n=1 Tax=Naumannella cuiyingiana TaxID=1347891 RepID=A0A7Z0D8U2_9ACTN|nr:hypothetical protein [Naumannella cuiyingiana]
MTNGNQTSGGRAGSGSAEAVSRADRIMGRSDSPTRADGQPPRNDGTAPGQNGRAGTGTTTTAERKPQGRTTQSWRPPSKPTQGAAGNAAKNAGNDKAGNDTSGSARPAGGNGGPVATGRAAAAVPPSGTAGRNGTASPQQARGNGALAPATRQPATDQTTRLPSQRTAASASSAPARPRSGSAGTASSVTSASQFGAARRTRKARLRLARLDPWSVMKTAFLFSIAAGIMLVVATAAVYGVLETSGLFDAINTSVSQVVSSPNDPNQFDIKQVLDFRRVLGAAAVISALNVVIFTALATLFSFLYNISATVLGGLEVTLAED